MHPLFLYFLLIPMSAQADLFKCIDRTGQVTYTNLPCDKAGLKESKVIPPPPPPAVSPKPQPSEETDDVRHEPDEKLAKSARKKESAEAPTLELLRPGNNNDKKCTKLNDDIGKTMDDMDAARRHGYTPQQEADWNDKLRKLQSKKNQLGCF